MEELTEKEVLDIFALAADVKEALRKTFGAEGFNLAWNEGKKYGQSVPHFHLHIVPRTPGDDGITEYEPRKFLYRPGSREGILPSRNLRRLRLLSVTMLTSKDIACACVAIND